MVDKIEHIVTSSNKLGFINSVSDTIVREICDIETNDILLDGENLNHQFHVFDILRYKGICLIGHTAKERHTILSTLQLGQNLIKVPMHIGSNEKR